MAKIEAENPVIERLLGPDLWKEFKTAIELSYSSLGALDFSISDDYLMASVRIFGEYYVSVYMNERTGGNLFNEFLRLYPGLWVDTESDAVIDIRNHTILSPVPVRFRKVVDKLRKEQEKSFG